ncbi:MAG TPA: PAS domain-containing protein, partial [Thermodesulfobacteriota bacterium]|nr:PAS domain-containing protein [Thermodesulfobacteriota bacterium]
MNGQNGMEKLLSMEKALEGMMEVHRLVGEMKDLESQQQRKIDFLEGDNKRYRSFLDSLPVGLCIKDRNSVYAYCNKRYAMDFNIPAEDIVGKKDRGFFPIDVAERTLSEDQRIMGAGQSEETEETY